MSVCVVQSSSDPFKFKCFQCVLCLHVIIRVHIHIFSVPFYIHTYTYIYIFFYYTTCEISSANMGF